MAKTGNITVTCSQCGKDTLVWANNISKNKTGNYFCDLNCKKLFFVGSKNPAFNSVHHNCDYCGREILVKQYNLKRYNLNFCNKQCKNEYDKAQYIEVPCNYCGKKKTMNIWNANRSKNHFCDKQCKGKWQSENLSGIDSTHYDKILVTCSNCGKEKHVSKCVANRSKNLFCNKKCKGEWMSKNKIGENSSGWKGGLTEKLKLVRASIDMVNWRKSIFKRDNYTCQFCGDYGSVLNAHHIVPLTIDENKIFDINNGITLCESCHKKAHMNDTIENNIFVGYKWNDMYHKINIHEIPKTYQSCMEQLKKEIHHDSE
jgi:endogenous inhibitor of DNA gyrase (YacG/DUF329 family)